MQIVIDEPGRRFVLEETEARMPLRFVLAGLVITLLIAAPWRVLWQDVVQGGGPLAWDPVPSAFVLAAGVYLILLGRGGTRIEHLAVNRDTGRIEWRRTFLAGVVSWTRHADIELVEALVVEREPGEMKEAPKRRKPPALWFTIELKTRGGSVTPLKLRVDDVSDVAGLADFASRLGSALGLTHVRVLRHDPFAYRIEVRQDDAQGAKSAVGPFDPTVFRGSLSVAAWDPGREVRFRKGLSGEILLAPLLLGVALPVAAWLRLPSLHEGDLLPRMVALGMITMIGLALGLVGFVSLQSGLPREVRFDWAAKELRFVGAWSERVIPFAHIGSIEMRGRVYRHRNIRLYTTWYIAAIRVRLLTAQAPASLDELVADTVGSRDPTEAAAMALPLASALANALGVAVVKTDPVADA